MENAYCTLYFTAVNKLPEDGYIKQLTCGSVTMIWNKKCRVDCPIIYCIVNILPQHNKDVAIQISSIYLYTIDRRGPTDTAPYDRCRLYKHNGTIIPQWLSALVLENWQYYPAYSGHQELFCEGKVLQLRPAVCFHEMLLFRDGQIPGTKSSGQISAVYWHSIFVGR